MSESPLRGGPARMVGEFRGRWGFLLSGLLAVLLAIGCGFAAKGVHTALPVLGDEVVQAARPQGIEVRLVVDGMNMAVSSRAERVRDVLAEVGILLRPRDKLNPDKDSPLAPGMTIKVIRMTEETVTRRTSIPFPVERRSDPGLEQGKTRVIRRGVDGLKEQKVLITYENGRPVAEKLLSERILRYPVAQVVSVGTQRPHRTLVTSRGTYRYRQKYRMLATAYDPGPVSCGRYADGYTAIGLKAGRGVVAVDPDVIPLRTRLYVTGYGHAIAGDVGAAIKGHRIDLGFDTLQEALNYGRRWVDVYVLEP